MLVLRVPAALNSLTMLRWVASAVFQLIFLASFKMAVTPRKIVLDVALFALSQVALYYGVKVSCLVV